MDLEANGTGDWDITLTWVLFWMNDLGMLSEEFLKADKRSAMFRSRLALCFLTAYEVAYMQNYGLHGLLRSDMTVKRHIMHHWATYATERLKQP